MLFRSAISIALARRGARVLAVDTSLERLSALRRRAREMGCSDRIRLVVAAAEALARSATLLEEVPSSGEDFESVGEELRELWADPRDLARLGGWARDRFNPSEERALVAPRTEVAARARRVHVLLEHRLKLDPQLLLLLRQTLQPLLGDVAMPHDPSKSIYLGSANSDVYICLVRTDAEIGRAHV